MSTRPTRSRLLLVDIARAGSLGLRARRMRAGLSALGIAIGVASVVSVLGISASSEAELLNELGRLGNLLYVTPAPGGLLPAVTATLPASAAGQIARLPSVLAVTATGTVPTTTVRRTDKIPSTINGGISIVATRLDLLSVFGASLRQGVFLNRATEALPAVVLGSSAAQRLGIDRVDGPVRVWIGNEWFTVVGILDPVQADPDIDLDALIGFPIAQTVLGFTGSPDTIYVRAVPDAVTAVRTILPDAANPSHPDEVQVSRPSDALAARAAAKGALNSLLVALGAVALLVGGVGIANVMVISVLERKSEIGLRRALGATRAHVAAQFLAESLMLSGAGAGFGLMAAIVVISGYSRLKGMPLVVPVNGVAIGVVAGLIIGALAGLYPAARAARLSPTDALRTG